MPVNQVVNESMLDEYDGIPDGELPEPDVMPVSPEPGPASAIAPWEQDDANAWVSATNLAEYVDEDTLKTIGRNVVEDYKIDKESREDWEKEYAEALKLARLTREAKSEPWEHAANIKYPLITQAAIQFNARAYSSIINNGRIVKGRVIGRDAEGKKADRAERIGLHMSYQLTEQMDGWEDGLDTTLLMLPTVGTCFKKTYRDHSRNVNASEYVPAEDVIINYRVRTVERAPRVTHPFELYPNEIESFIRSEIYLDGEYKNTTSLPVEAQEAEDIGEDGQIDARDSSAPQLFYEQHRWLDLDEDGYEEPYIVTVHAASQAVVRITARFDVDGVIRKKDKYGVPTKEIIRIDPVNIWTVMQFLPSLDGSVYGLGFGLLMGHMNETVNATINQLLDAGTNQNTGGGFISKAVSFMKKGLSELKFRPGEWKQVTVQGATLRESIVPRETPQPSFVLMKLLELMIDTSKMISNSDLLAGEMPPANTPATTTVTLIEQSLKVYSGVYKRVYRALKEEFKKLHRLNKLYMTDEEYFTVTDMTMSVARVDYEDRDCDVVPECDPNNMSDAVTMMRAQALMEFNGDPEINSLELKKNLFEAMSIPDAKRFFKTPEEMSQMVNPEIEIEKGKLEVAQRRQELQEQKHELDKIIRTSELEKMKAEIGKINAEATLALAKAESEDAATTIESLRALIDQGNIEKDALISRIDALGKLVTGGAEGAESGVEGSPAMAGAPGNEGVSQPDRGTNQGNEGEPIERDNVAYGLA